MKKASIYTVSKLRQPIPIDGDWRKYPWKNSKSLEIKHFMGVLPGFCPSAWAKAAYDDENIYVIFFVKDRYVRCIEQDYNAPVSNDSCVEFFFSPDIDLPERYFNLEVNCGGTALLKYNLIPRKEYTFLEPDDIRRIPIAHSLPSHIDVEIVQPVTWTIEYKIPFDLLRKFSNVAVPRPGVTWRANFYKIAAKTSNPHWMTWSFVHHPTPDFHLPQHFGTLQFE